MAKKRKKRKESAKKEEEIEPIEVFLFKSDTCAFCPRAEEIVTETIDGFEPNTFKLSIINVSDNPESAEEYGIFALPTVMIGGISVTGIPEPETIMKMILGARIQKKKGKKK